MVENFVAWEKSRTNQKGLGLSSTETRDSQYTEQDSMKHSSSSKAEAKLAQSGNRSPGALKNFSWAFYPSSMGSFDSGSMSLHKIADYFGVNSFADTRKLGDFVIGDGVGVNYTLRLRLGRGLGRGALDETRLTIN